MNSAEKEAVLHCLKSMIDEEVCEECPLYGTTGTDHCEKDCVRLAINALSRSGNPNKWIPVSERLPEMGVRVLCACQADLYDVLKLTPEGWFYDTRHTYMFGFVRAWMPLPDPYKASPTSCSTCILDNTDACTRGAGRAVDDEACEDYLASPTGAEGSEE